MSTISFIVSRGIEAIQLILKKNVTIKSQKGVTIIEYAFLGILIAAVVFVSAKTVGERVAELFVVVNSGFP